MVVTGFPEFSDGGSKPQISKSRILLNPEWREPVFSLVG
jgi:hypothetical protein